METVMAVFAFFATVAALASAVFAYVQARAATDAREEADAARDETKVARDEAIRLAAEANAAFVRQAEAQEAANALKVIELTPQDWSVSRSGPNTQAVRNTSRRTLLVEAMIVLPAGTEGLLPIDTSHHDGRYEYGDSFRFSRIRLMGPSPEKLTITYRYEGEDEPGDFRRFHITLD